MRMFLINSIIVRGVLKLKYGYQTVHISQSMKRSSIEDTFLYI
ncbi:hypothetical protein CLOAM0671 [Candidatus Cloacimonas acidaminovorans str. Evry]|uniref:Uncharacterized protein n=1 Tax=Cloacimonas acidaminovorans (strain Evry) TaxID=459349 RepID=B0VGU6_CLOAI|nr:hypothetical protein CLOAM0671 [Candidatus Cloacimonas acidaminovorans str. Evry]